MYPYIQIFGQSIGTYGLISMLGAVLCGAVFIIALRKRGATMENGVFFLLFVILGIVVGSHLLYAITRYRLIPYLFKKADFSWWMDGLQYIFGGSVFYGGLIGGMISGYIGLKVLKQDVMLYADLMAPVAPLFHGIARVGCFFAGCCYGIECKWGFCATGNTLVPAVNDVTRFPVQLLEASCNLILAGVMFWLLHQSNRHPKLRGNLFYYYLVIYGIIRFCDEFLRGDEIRGFWGILSTSQWISIVVVMLGSVMIAKNAICRKTKNPQPTE